MKYDKCISCHKKVINHLKTVAKTAIDSGYDSAVVDAVDMARETLEQEPWEDAVSREAVEDIVMWYDGQREMLDEIQKLPSVQPKQKTGLCKDCKYFQYDSAVKVDGAPLILAHEICSRWGNGCKTREDGYCFLFESQESEVVNNEV